MKRRDTLPSMLLGRAAALGEAGQQWLDGLDALVAALEARWQIRVGTALHGGSHAFVAPAAGPDGAPYVLKIELPDAEPGAFLQGVEALRIAAGRGYGRLCAFDPDCRAQLLERLGGTLKDLNYPVPQQLEILCTALRESWKIPAQGARLPDGAASIAWFRGFIPEAWAALGRPCPERVIADALRLLDERESRLGEAEGVLLHGDAHNNNLLQTLDGRGFRFIDPDGILYEPAYDLGVLMREWPEAYRTAPLAAGRARCRLLHQITGVDEAGIWAWGRLQTVSTGLVLLQIGERALGAQLLDTAAAWIGE